MGPLPGLPETLEIPPLLTSALVDRAAVAVLVQRLVLVEVVVPVACTAAVEAVVAAELRSVPVPTGAVGLLL